MLCLVMIVAAVVTLAACNKNGTYTPKTNKSLKLDNYIPDYKDESVSNVVVSQKVEIRKMFQVDATGTVNIYGLFAVIGKVSGGTTKYDVYSWKTGEKIKSDLTYMPTTQTFNYSTGDRVLCTRDTDGSSSYAYSYYFEDGTTVLQHVMESSIVYSVKQRYVEGAKELKTVYEFTGTDKNDNEVKAYFLYEKKDDAYVYTSVSENKLSFFDTDYKAGNVPQLPNFVPEDDDYPVESDIANYTYTAIGSEMAFYKDGKQVGSIDLRGKKMIGFVDHYIYYYDVKPVAASATEGFNYCGANDEKAMLTLCRYDIYKNKTVDYKFDIYVEGIMPVYNKETKAYDGALLGGFELVDGVYYENSNSDMNNYRRAVIQFVDSELNIAKDLSSLATTSVYKLTDDRYLSYSSAGESYLLDGNFNVINLPGRYHVFYPEQRLVKFTYNSCIGFVDFDGKVVIEPKYTEASSGSTTFIQDCILLINEETNETVCVNSKGVENALPESDGDKSVSLYNGYYTVREVDDDGDGTMKFFSYDGQLLNSFILGAGKTINISGGVIIYSNDESRSYYKIIVEEAK